MISLHETCKQYVARRLSEGWSIVSQRGCHLILSSPDGNILRPVDLRNDVETLRPDGAGDSTQFNIAGVSPAPTNWESVDEVVADDITTTVSKAVSAAKDLYNIANPTFADGAAINNVTVYWRIYWGSSAYKRGYCGIKSGGTESWGSEKTFVGAWTDYNTVYVNDPNTSNPWTKAAVTALQVGVKIDTGADQGLQCTQVYAEVDYSPAPPPGLENKSANMGSKMVGAGLI